MLTLVHIPQNQDLECYSLEDKLECRGKNYFCARDNVILELGASLGYLGRGKTFIIAISTKDREIKIPSDLSGLTIFPWKCEKNFEKVEQFDLDAILVNLRKAIINRDSCISLLQYDLFTKFNKSFEQLFKGAQSITTSFIHGRNWRENNANQIKEFLSKANVSWTFLLPDIEDFNLIKNLKAHFDDGATMISKIIDCYYFCSNLLKMYPNKVHIYLYSFSYLFFL